MDIEKTILKKIFKCNKEYNLFNKTERIIISLSGGKDSISLLKLLTKIHSPSLIYPIHIYPYKDDKVLSYIKNFSENTLSMANPVKFLKNPLYKKDLLSCYECARGRRKTVFEEADKQKIYKIALGHTKNDVSETFLMNVIYSGNKDTIKPFQTFFDGKFQIIRPLYMVEEKELLRYSDIYHITPQNYHCSGKESNKRENIRAFLRNLKDDYVIQRVFNAAVIKKQR